MNNIILPQSTQWEPLMQNLHEVKAKIRKIDPALLGESRYPRENLFKVVKKIIDLFYKLKNFLYKSRIKELQSSLEALNAHRTDMETQQQSGQTAPVPHPLQPAITIENLPISEEEKTQIGRLIPMVAEDTIRMLIGKLPTLMEAKRKMNALHPLKSLEFIFKDPKLSQNMVTMSKTASRWVGIWGIAKGFKPQTAEKLKAYHEQGKIMPYFPSFCTSIGLNEEQKQRFTLFAEGGKWEEMLQALVDNSKNQVK